MTGLPDEANIATVSRFSAARRVLPSIATHEESSRWLVKIHSPSGLTVIGRGTESLDEELR
jgi:hypothetical protein